MAIDLSDDVLARLRVLEKRAASLDEEVTRLRSANLELTAKVRDAADPAVEPAGERRLSRSQFLRLGSAAAAGAVVAGATGMLSASPAAADETKGGHSPATGGALLIGSGANTPTAPTDTTVLFGASTTELSSNLLRISNRSSASIFFPAARIAAGCITSGSDTTAQRRVGMWGQTDTITTGYGVIGRNGTTGADPLTAFRSGVVGAAADNGNGVTGICNGSVGWGVEGISDAGIGVLASSNTGLSVVAGGGGRIRQNLRAAGAPAAGTFSAGEQIRDANGELWLCVAGGTPGTWRRAATVREGFVGGSINFLSAPIRLFDSRPGVPVAPGTNRDVQITGVVVGGVSVPAGAKGVIGNLTVVSTVASGFLVVFATGAAVPGTASINWFAANQILNTLAMSRLSAAGMMTIRNGSGAATDAIFDAVGFVF